MELFINPYLKYKYKHIQKYFTAYLGYKQCSFQSWIKLAYFIPVKDSLINYISQ